VFAFTPDPELTGDSLLGTVELRVAGIVNRCCGETNPLLEAGHLACPSAVESPRYEKGPSITRGYHMSSKVVGDLQ
jgi:hypothetical protein